MMMMLDRSCFGNTISRHGKEEGDNGGGGSVDGTIGTVTTLFV